MKQGIWVRRILGRKDGVTRRGRHGRVLVELFRDTSLGDWGGGLTINRRRRNLDGIWIKGEDSRFDMISCRGIDSRRTGSSLKDLRDSGPYGRTRSR